MISNDGFLSHEIEIGTAVSISNIKVNKTYKERRALLYHHRLS